MKNINSIRFAILSIFFFCSCEKVIDLNLDETEPQIVIEAQLKEGNNTFSVFISKTTPYFEPGSQTSIENASVVLSDDQGNTITMLHTSGGEYSANITGKPGTLYTLSVQIDDMTYEASSFMLSKVNLTRVEAEFESGGLIEDDGYQVIFYYQDPEDIPNYYRAIFYLNGKPQLEGENLQVLNDDFNDGEETRSPIFGDVFQVGDKVTVELVHLDKPAYDYFKSLADILGEGGLGAGVAAPGNPNSNWSGGVLGHFTAFSSDTLTVVIE